MFDLFTKTGRWSQIIDRKFLSGFSDRSRIYRYCEFTYGVERSFDKFSYVDRRHYYSIVQIDLGRQMPHLFFDSHHTSGKQTSHLITPNQEDKLEYGFERYFSMYFPEHYRIDARSIISPEVMEKLLEAKDYDIEIYGNNLFLYSRLVKLADIPGFVARGLAIRQSIIDHSQYYRDTRHPDSLSNRKAIAEIGAKLVARAPFPWLMTTAGIGFLLIGVMLTTKFIQSLDQGSQSSLENIFYSLSMVVMGGWFTIYRLREWHEKNSSSRELARSNQQYAQGKQKK